MIRNMKRQTETVTDKRRGPAKSEGPLLRVEDLCLYFRASYGVVRAVEGASFELERGRSLAVLGESGCGKT